MSDVYLLWGGRVDETYAYKYDVKTVVLTPSCRPGVGKKDEHTFFWDGTVSFRSNGEEVYSLLYDINFKPLLSYALMAFVFAPVDVWMRMELYDENKASKWLHDTGNLTMLYRARQ
jgi:hypothetical protein